MGQKMGKFHSKHVCRREGPEGECFLVDAQLNPMSQEESVVSESGSNPSSPVVQKSALLADSVPLRVVLPPMKTGSEKTAHIFTLDKSADKPTDNADTTDNNVTDNSINVEEISCGVSVDSSDRQEWAFTLYDFDGRGRITKEDLAGLLRSLYDAVGSSISLPQPGTKSLKLKLTVSPDHSNAHHLTAADKPALTSPHSLTAQQPHKRKSGRHHKDKENHRHNKLNNLKAEKAANGDLKNNLSPSGGSGGARVPENGAEHEGHEALDQRHLVQLVQRNMERHQRQLKKIRRQTSDARPSSSRPSALPQENLARRSYYMDLAGIDHSPTALTSPPKLLNTSAPAGALDPHHRGSGHRSRHKHKSSRHKHKQPSPDPQQEEEPAGAGVDPCVSSEIERTAEQLVLDIAPAPAAAAQRRAISPKLASTPKTHHRVRPVSSPVPIKDSVSPHHQRRHRHRDKQHQRAMQQVAAWIEREHSVSPSEPQPPASQQALVAPSPGALVPSCALGEHLMVQRHEHHHIHEHHHHHHYHHYHET